MEDEIDRDIPFAKNYIGRNISLAKSFIEKYIRIFFKDTINCQYHLRQRHIYVDRIFT